MVIYFEGGSLSGRAKNAASKKINAVPNKISPTKTEWYRKTGKHVFLKQNKGILKKEEETIRARVFRFDNIVEKKEKKAV